MGKVGYFLEMHGQKIGIGLAVTIGTLATVLYARNLNVARRNLLSRAEQIERAKGAFTRQPPLPEPPIITPKPEPKEKPWPGDIFAERGIDLPKRIEDAKKTLAEKLPTGEQKYQVEGLPLGKRNLGRTAIWLAALEITKNKIEVIRMETERNLPARGSHKGFSIILGTPNGANTDIDVESPPNYVVLAIKTPIYQTDSDPNGFVRQPKTAKNPGKNHGKKPGKKPAKAAAKPKKKNGKSRAERNRGPSYFECMRVQGRARESVVPAIYSPYKRVFSNNRELVQKGARYLQELTAGALASISSHRIPPYAAGVRALSPELLFTILMVERVDPNKFVAGYILGSGPGKESFKEALEAYNGTARRKVWFDDSEIQKLEGDFSKVVISDTKGREFVVAKQGGKLRLYDLEKSIESLVLEVLATAGANGPDSFNFAVSIVDARGIGQIMPGTYCGTYDNFSRFVPLDIDFLRGTRVHATSAVYQALIAAEALNSLRDRIDLSDFEQKVIAFAASYNYGYGRVGDAIAGSEKWAGDYREPWISSGSTPEIDALKRGMDATRSRIRELQGRFQRPRKGRGRPFQPLELGQLRKKLEADNNRLAAMQAAFKQSQVGGLVPETAKYVREAAAIIDLMPGLRKKGLFLADAKPKPPPGR